MLVLNAPTPLDGDLLTSELGQAGLTAEVTLNGDQIELRGLGEQDRAAAQTVVDAHPTTAQAEADRVASERTNETSVRDKAAQALTANTTDISTNDGFLAIVSPTNAQIAAQVKELTRQSSRQARELSALIRLVLRRFESAD